MNALRVSFGKVLLFLAATTFISAFAHADSYS